MLNSLGTFQNAGLSSDEIQTALTGKCDIGNVTSVLEIEDGVNASAVLTTENSEKYFIKFNTFTPSSRLFYAQPFILSYFNNGHSGVSTPQIIGYDYTRTKLPYGWYLTEYISGDAFDTEKNKISVEKAQTVGRILGQINSISVDGYGYPNQEHNGASCSVSPSLPFTQDEESWEDHLKSEMRQFINTADSRFSSLREPLHSFIESQSIREITPHLTHFDYWWENILWADKQPYVIDWERAVGGDPIANRILSEHYLFDRVAIESQVFSEGEYPSDRRTMMKAFRTAYESSYTGSQALQIDSDTEQMYHLLLYVRELRGFPYWWRNKSDEWTEKRADALREGITSILNDD